MLESQSGVTGDPRLASLPPEARLIVLVSQAMERATTPLEVAERAFPHLTAAADAAWMTLARFQDERLWPLALLGDFPPALQPFLELVRKGVPRGMGVAWRAFEAGRPIYVERYAGHDAAHDGMARAFEGAIAYLPLLDERGTAWGMLSLAANRSREQWPEGMKLALETVARLIGNSVERTLSQEAERRHASYLRLLGALQDALQAALTPREVAEVALAHLGPALEASAVHALRVRRGFLHHMHVWGQLPPGVSAATSPEGLSLEAAQVSRQVVESGEAAYLDDYSSRPDALDFGAEPVSIGVEPIKDASGRVVGLLSIARPSRLGPWLEEERFFMARSAAAIALALGRTADRDALLEERRRAEVLAALADALSSARDPASVTRAALDQLGPALGARYLTFARLDGDRLILTDTWGEVPQEVCDAFQGGMPRSRGGLTWRAVQHGEPVYASSYQEEADRIPLDLPDAAAAIKPIRGHGEQVTAVLTVVRSPGHWSGGERDLLARGAATIGHALERADADALLADKTRELEARNAEQETFVYTASHDLRTPLLSLRGMATLLAEAVEENDVNGVRHFLARITANVEKMDALLDSLLRLSRVGRAADAIEVFPLGETVQAVRADLEGRIAARDLRLELPEEWPLVRYPRNEAYQLIVNLFGNAVKWAGRPGKRPRVSLLCEQEGETVRLEVHDNGPGVPSEYRERVFRLFEKLDARSEGTGVGLAIVERIVSRYGGRAWVEDSPLGGAAFVVTLPGGQA